MKNELISMVDFVLATGETSINDIDDWDLWNSIYDYATFLNTPLNISMFVPAIKVGNEWEVLEMPEIGRGKKYSVQDKSIKSQIWHSEWHKRREQYQTAKDNVIFEGFDIDGKFISHNQVSYLIDRLHYNTIQDLIKYKPTLTKKGVEVSGLNNK